MDMAMLRERGLVGHEPRYGLVTPLRIHHGASGDEGRGMGGGTRSRFGYNHELRIRTDTGLLITMRTQ